MTLREIINKILYEERHGGETGEFQVELGENEGEHIPHFHLKNNETSQKKKKKTAVRIDMPYYFIHGDKTYRLNSSELKMLNFWLSKPPTKNITKSKEGEFPKK